MDYTLPCKIIYVTLPPLTNLMQGKIQFNECELDVERIHVYYPCTNQILFSVVDSRDIFILKLK